LLRDIYRPAHVNLEMGSGRVNVHGAENGQARVTAVESDKAWAQMMRACV